MNCMPDQNHPIQEVADLIQGMAGVRTLLVGIDGGAGSGKTSFVRWLAGRLIGKTAEGVRPPGTPVSIVHNDEFFRPSAERWK